LRIATLRNEFALKTEEKEKELRDMMEIGEER